MLSSDTKREPKQCAWPPTSPSYWEYANSGKRVFFFFCGSACKHLIWNIVLIRIRTLTEVCCACKHAGTGDYFWSNIAGEFRDAGRHSRSGSVETLHNSCFRIPHFLKVCPGPLYNRRGQDAFYLQAAWQHFENPPYFNLLQNCTLSFFRENDGLFRFGYYFFFSSWNVMGYLEDT